MLRIGDILSGLLEWAPASLAWERDNIGLLIGSPDREVERVLVCLDVTEAVAREAVERGAQCIVAHHPLIFHPLKSIRTDTARGRLIELLLRERISVIAMHTNADAAHDGLNAELAAVLGIENPRRLDAPQGMLRKLVVHIAGGTVVSDDVAQLLTGFPECRWTSHALTDGSAVEIVVPAFRLGELRSVLAAELGTAMRDHHVVSVEGALTEYGIGVTGERAEALPVRDFLALVKERLGCAVLRTTPFDEKLRIRRVAVSSGAGSSYVQSAIAAGAEVLVTGDLSHHVFLDHADDILLVDAGHYETEQLFIRICADELQRRFFDGKKKIDILHTQTDTNPVWFI